MRFAIFHIIIALVVVWRFVLPLRLKPLPKALFSLVVLAMGSFAFVTTTFFGGLLSPELPRPVLLVGNTAEAFVLFLACLTVLREVVIFLTVLAGRSGRLAHRLVQRDRRAAFGMAAAAAGTAVFSMWQGVKVPEVVDHTIEIEDLPEALDGFTFVQLSDTHCSALLTEPHTEMIVERVNALEPDLILITGDLVDGMVDRRLRDVAPMARFRARLGVWGCEGNHEHYGDYDGWRREFARLGIRLLYNEHVLLKAGEKGTICLAGLCDPRAELFGREMPDPEKAFAGAPDPAEAFRIVMAHQPKYFPDYRRRAPFALQLSGHTHGGQLIGFDQTVAVMNNLYVRGEYALKDGTKLFVHPGSGAWNGFMMRLGVPSEIARIRLVRAAAKA